MLLTGQAHSATSLVGCEKAVVMLLRLLLNEPAPRVSILIIAAALSGLLF